MRRNSSYSPILLTSRVSSNTMKNSKKCLFIDWTIFFCCCQYKLRFFRFFSFQTTLKKFETVKKNQSKVTLSCIIYLSIICLYIIQFVWQLNGVMWLYMAFCINLILFQKSFNVIFIESMAMMIKYTKYPKQPKFNLPGRKCSYIPLSSDLICSIMQNYNKLLHYCFY